MKWIIFLFIFFFFGMWLLVRFFEQTFLLNLPACPVCDTAPILTRWGDYYSIDCPGCGTGTDVYIERDDAAEEWIYNCEMVCIRGEA